MLLNELNEVCMVKKAEGNSEWCVKEKKDTKRPHRAETTRVSNVKLKEGMHMMIWLMVGTA